MIEFRNIKKNYERREVAIENANFKIDEGEFVFLVGPSGAGKSTLIKMMYRDEKPTAGRIFMFGKDIGRLSIPKLRRHLGIVLQDFHSSLLAKKTAYENVAFVLKQHGKSPRIVKKEVRKALEKLGLGDKMHKYPHQLSGGEQQRVAIARAIVHNPQIIICDEPLGDLDSENAKNVMKYLNLLNQEGSTIVMSTHNEEIVKSENKRIIVVNDGMVRQKEEVNTETISGIMSGTHVHEGEEVAE
ncbi:cell division ATP-binding protein FtsE [Priestia megaterium]|nr:cell division ATP-binding protein FtsE [Priestia megaterium]